MSTMGVIVWYRNQNGSFVWKQKGTYTLYVQNNPKTRWLLKADDFARLRPILEALPIKFVEEAELA